MIDLTLETPISTIVDYLLDKKILTQKPQEASTEKPGEGNMNLVLRFQYDQYSVILKQSKAFVNKYPSIPAPEERIATEAQYYKYAAQIPQIVHQMPKLLHYDVENNLTIMEDLGEGSDFMYVYDRDKTLTNNQIEALLTYLSHLHRKEWSVEEQNAFPDNLKLRQLNHQHIFVLPFQLDNGFDLNQIQEGLEVLAKIYAADELLKREITSLGEDYLASGSHLLHGDYYPGSWMQVGEELKIIDPEFGFMGAVEFELGVFIAHLLMSGHVLAQIIQGMNDHYEVNFDQSKALKYAGVEMMRRLIGIAQLPLSLDLDEKAKLLEMAHNMILR
ncbi:MAG: aminoglycoside phosphotransferase [Bacteroidota bacterium]